MIKRALFVFVAVVLMASCQFTETMTLNEDGSGRMSVMLDMSEMMAFGGMGEDTTVIKMDTLVALKDYLEEKKDSIAQLPMAEQKRLKRMENFKMRMYADSDVNEMLLDVFVDFNSIEEANDIMNGLGESSNFLDTVGDVQVSKDESSEDVMGVNFSFKDGKFMRDAYIKDPEKYKVQLDSLGGAEAFLGGMKYTIKYTFPRKIVKTNQENATFSLDGKTMEFEVGFLDYFKNPDLLDIEVELEQ